MERTNLPTKATTRRTPELYNAVKNSPGKCVVYNGELRVLYNVEYRKELAQRFVPAQQLNDMFENSLELADVATGKGW